jgi:adenylate cyclase
VLSVRNGGFSTNGERDLRRLTQGARPTAGIATIEDPHIIVRLVAGTLVASVVMTGAIAFLMFRFDEPVAGWSTLGLTAVYLVVFVWYLATGRVVGPAVLAMVASFVDVTIVHVALGGFAYSGGYLAWGISLTFALVLMLGRREGIVSGVLLAVLAVVLAFFEAPLAAGRAPPDPGLRAFLFASVLIGNLAVVTAALIYFLRRISLERQRAEHLLLNVLPGEVAEELKERGRVEPRRFDSISVVFADIVGFTQRYAGADPGEMVDQLNGIFTRFDTLAAKYGCEKIRTIGDAYMVAAGVPVARPDHAQAAAGLALEMLEYSAEGPFTFRIGINSGPVVAGVIGTSKFQYDVWGDTVNTASRMESHGEPGRIQISETSYRLIADDFICVPRGAIQVKGKGELTTWFLEGRSR